MRPEGEDSPGVDAEGPLTCGVSRCSGLSKYSSTRTTSLAVYSRGPAAELNTSDPERSLRTQSAR